MEASADPADVFVIGAAAATDDTQSRQHRPKCNIVACQCFRVAAIKGVGVVEFFVTHPGRVRTDAADPLQPIAATVEECWKCDGWAQLIM